MDEEQEEEQSLSMEAAQRAEYGADVAEMDKLQLEKGDIIVFRNGEIGKISSFNINNTDMIYNFYVKVGNMEVVIGPKLKEVTEDKNYDIIKIVSKDFTNIKKEIEVKPIIITKEEAEKQLSEAQGETVIISE